MPAEASIAPAAPTETAIPATDEAPPPLEPPASRMDQSLDEFEVAFEQAQRVEKRRRRELRRRAANRSRAREIVKTEKRGRVRFSVLAVCLTATVVVVTIVMFETLAWLVGG